MPGIDFPTVVPELTIGQLALGRRYRHSPCDKDKPVIGDPRDRSPERVKNSTPGPVGSRCFSLRQQRRQRRYQMPRLAETVAHQSPIERLAGIGIDSPDPAVHGHPHRVDTLTPGSFTGPGIA